MQLLSLSIIGPLAYRPLLELFQASLPAQLVQLQHQAFQLALPLPQEQLLASLQVQLAQPVQFQAYLLAYLQQLQAYLLVLLR
jgi:hypothetical protein